MRSLGTWRLRLAVVVVASAILLAGGLAVGAEANFNFVKPLCLAGPAFVGYNWTSIPYTNSYVDYAGLCSQTGLPSDIANTAVLEMLDPVYGYWLTQTCYDAVFVGGAISLKPGHGVSIRVPNVPGNPTSITLVGSHDSTVSLTIPPPGAGQIGNLWFAYPYHTTAVTFNDLCVQAGMNRGIAESRSCETGAYITRVCPSLDAQNTNLVIGEFVRLRDPFGVTFIPAHF